MERIFSGTMQVKLISADVPGAMEMIQKADILIWDISYEDPITVCFEVYRRDWRKLSRIFHKRGDEWVVCGKRGLFWYFANLRKRPVLVFGILALLLMGLWLPSRVLFVQVEGNVQIDSRLIAEAAAKCGISFGANRKQVRSEKMKNALLEAIPQLSWAGVNTYGCTAVISVRERAQADTKPETLGVGSIVASRDGIIREITVLRGKGMCVTGQAVKAGQVLISGYTDCGIVIQATCAKGEVYAQTSRSLTAIFPQICSARGEEVGRDKKYSIIIGKKRINFSNNSRISGASCAKIYEQRYVTLPGGFVLPISFVVETSIAYETEERMWEYDLVSASRQYLLSTMCAGRILISEETLESEDGLRILYGKYSCYEMIGITKLEERI